MPMLGYELNPQAHLVHLINVKSQIVSPIDGENYPEGYAEVQKTETSHNDAEKGTFHNLYEHKNLMEHEASTKLNTDRSLNSFFSRDETGSLREPLSDYKAYLIRGSIGDSLENGDFLINRAKDSTPKALKGKGEDIEDRFIPEKPVLYDFTGEDKVKGPLWGRWKGKEEHGESLHSHPLELQEVDTSDKNSTSYEGQELRRGENPAGITFHDGQEEMVYEVSGVGKRQVFNERRILNVKLEDAQVRLSFLKNRLWLSLEINEELYRQPTPLEVQRLVHSLQSLGYNIEVLMMNGSNLYSFDQRQNSKKEQRDGKQDFLRFVEDIEYTHKPFTLYL
ncbi:MAG: hypothetical protein D6674_03200 [Acidobacteria bacterium]|nr:MAG: hypothetical protein D6674_03200 [Acidobacteriota bacterium]